jgi:hypothetical protein
MAKIRIIPEQTGNPTQEDLAVINAEAQVFPEQSLWVVNDDGSLSPSSHIPARSGSWITRFNLTDIDQPPLVSWYHSPGEPNDVAVELEDNGSRAYLRVSNIDVQPAPLLLYPDIYWHASGLDLTPRSS